MDALTTKKQALYERWVYLAKADLNAAQQAYLRRSLTVERVHNYDRGEAPPPTAVYVENETYIGVPRAYFDRFLADKYEVTYAFPDHLINPWEDAVPAFKGTLLPEQKKAIECVQGCCRPGSFFGGILQAAPGWGKTVLACAVIASLRSRTLVVVHRDFLVSQWIKRIEAYLPGVRIGVVQGKKCDFRGCHVVIGVVHSLAKTQYPADFYDYFDAVMVDEVHTTVGASSWGLVPSRFSAPWRIGLTATPRRKDKAEDVFFYQIGGIFFRATQARLPLKVRTVKTRFRLLDTPDAALMERNELLDHLCNNQERNELIVDQLDLALEAGRTIFVLSERVDHLRLVDSMLRRKLSAEGRPAPSTGFYIGGLNEETRAVNSGARTILSTAQLATTALDIPRMDTAFCLTPLSDIEQAAGRILRPFDGKKDPLWVDFLDEAVPMCVAARGQREVQLKRLEAPSGPQQEPAHKPMDEQELVAALDNREET